MKNVLTTAACALTLGIAIPASANEGGSCHFHGSKPASEATVVDCANRFKNQYVDRGRLDKSWAGISKPEKVEQVDGNRGKEWRVIFKNAATPEKAKDTLYLFFSLPGNFIAANHNGQ